LVEIGKLKRVSQGKRDGNVIESVRCHGQASLKAKSEYLGKTSVVKHLSHASLEKQKSKQQLAD